MIFSKADKNNSGKLDLKELKEVVGDIIERYPQVDLFKEEPNERHGQLAKEISRKQYYSGD